MSNFAENWKGAQGGNQATSLATKLGFQDADRKTPEHDEIMLWLDQFVRAQEDEFIDSVTEPMTSSISDEVGTWVTWEHPIGDSRWLAGFIDLHLRIGRIRKHPAYDSVVTYRFAFEVKTTLPSLGDLIRQIRFYQEKSGRSCPTFYVVGPDNRYVATLRDQGIGFVEYPSGEITHPEK